MMSSPTLPTIDVFAAPLEFSIVRLGLQALSRLLKTG